MGADGVTGTPMSSDGFAFMWAGARAMYGVKKGKIAFETKVDYRYFDLVFLSSN